MHVPNNATRKNLNLPRPHDNVMIIPEHVVFMRFWPKRVCLCRTLATTNLGDLPIRWL